MKVTDKCDQCIINCTKMATQCLGREITIEFFLMSIVLQWRQKSHKQIKKKKNLG